MATGKDPPTASVSILAIKSEENQNNKDPVFHLSTYVRFCRAKLCLSTAVHVSAEERRGGVVPNTLLIDLAFYKKPFKRVPKRLETFAGTALTRTVAIDGFIVQGAENSNQKFCL